MNWIFALVFGQRTLTKTHRNLRFLSLFIEQLESRDVPTLLGQSLFPANYPYNQAITNAPVAANSAAVVNFIQNYSGTDINWPFKVELGTVEDKNQNYGMYGIPYNVVHGNTASMVNMTVWKYGNGTTVPYTLSIPMPSNAVLEGDHWTGPNTVQGYSNGGRGDSHLIVWDEDNNIDYEFFGVSRPNEYWGDTLTNAPDGVTWHAKTATIWNMNQDTLQPAPGGSVDAAGLAILPLLIRPDEALPTSQGGQGVINHAIRVTWQNAVIQNMFQFPADATANNGNNNPNMPLMGARLRLKSSFVIPSTWGPESKAIAQALKDYGLIIADNGANNSGIGASYSVDANNVPYLYFDQGSAYDVHVGNSNGIMSGDIKISDFEFVDQTPVVTGLSETSGTSGDTITITGQNFSYALPGQLSVLFGSTAATNVVVVNDSTVTATVPAGSGTENVYVQSGLTNSGYTNNINGSIFGYGISKQTVPFLFSGIPATPTGVMATSGVGNVTISWSAVSGATSYKLYRGTSAGGEGASPYIGSITGTSFSDIYGYPGYVYYYKVTAVNGGGESAKSAEVSGQYVTLPATPTGVTATSSVGDITISWSPVSGATSYNLYRGTSAGGEGAGAYIGTITGTSVNDTYGYAGYVYYYKVTAVNSNGESAKSSEVSGQYLTLPSAPTGVTATPSAGNITISWTAVSGATTYNLYRGTSAGSEGASFYIGTITGTSINDTYGYPDYVYYYKVTAVNSNGESTRSAEVSGQYVPAAPTGVTATSGVGNVTISWQPLSGATSYNLYRGTSSGGQGSGVYIGNITGTSISDTYGYPSYVYYYKVTAVNGSGAEGARSAEVSGQYRKLAATGQTTGTLRNNATGWYGFKFTTGAIALVITDLARWTASGNSGSHTIELVDASTNTVVASVSVNLSGATSGQYQYGSVSGVTLLANHSYYLLSQETSGGDQWYDDDSTVTGSADLTIVGSAYSTDNTTFHVNKTGSYSYGLVNFKYHT